MDRINHARFDRRTERSWISNESEAVHRVSSPNPPEPVDPSGEFFLEVGRRPPFRVMARSFADVLEAAAQGLDLSEVRVRQPFADLASVRAFEDHAATAEISELRSEKADAP